MLKLGALNALLMTPIVMPAIAVGAALASIALVYQKGKETLDLLDKMNAAQRNANDVKENAMKEVIANYKAGKISKEQYQNFFNGISGRATGGPISANTPYLVGERGPELVVPRQAGTVIPAGPTAQMLGGSGGNSVLIENLNVNNTVDIGLVARTIAWQLQTR